MPKLDYLRPPPQMHSVELTTRDQNQINAAYEAKRDVNEKVEAACGKVLTRHGVEEFHGPYSLTWNRTDGESKVTLEYFIG